MAQILRFDGVDHDLATLSAEARTLLERIQHCDARMKELDNMRALLTRSKNSYLSALKNEIVSGKSGVDLASLFSD
jgi:hypothetical protein